MEFFGGWVAANAVVQQKGGGLAAERCVSAPQPTWLVPDASTGSGEDAYLVVMNPFDVNAEFNVVFRTENRAIRPGPLSPGVLKPGRSLAIHVNSFVLAGPARADGDRRGAARAGQGHRGRRRHRGHRAPRRGGPARSGEPARDPCDRVCRDQPHVRGERRRPRRPGRRSSSSVRTGPVR